MRNSYFRPGECHRMLLKVFRDAAGAALGSRQVGEDLARRKGLGPTPEMLHTLQKTVHGAVHRLAYHVALLKGTDVDQPRNLAKSVTVE